MLLKKRCFPLLFFLIPFLGTPFQNSFLFADELQKVTILPFKNIDKNPNYEYLESTITDSIRDELKERFAFTETSEREWKNVARKYFLYEPECYTATFAMNLGLYSKQDVIVNGGFTIKKSPSEKESDTIETLVRLISVTEKRIISEITVDIPANNQIFQTIEKMADQAGKEASKVLPNKDDWARNDSKKVTAKKIFSNIMFGIRGGANIYLGGWADQFVPKLPVLTILLRANIPLITESFFIQVSFSYFQHDLLSNSINYFTANGLSLLSTNNVIGIFPGYDFELSRYFILSPRLGGGVIFQTTQISGSVSQNVSNTIPYASLGVDLTWLATETLSVVFDTSLSMEIENFPVQNKTVVTFFPQAQLGINIVF